MRIATRLTSALVLFAVTLTVSAQAQAPSVPKADDLYLEIAEMDRVLFEAFNNRDLRKQETIFARDIEFFHDQAGLLNYDQLIENTKRLFAQNSGLKRTLVPGSLEVYPIKGYGALEVGKHRFCHPESGRNDCGTFKFVQIWQKRSDGWKLTRVISYDH
ncbi:MAG TPA: nuclear transport factor 2 family protein [Thermoanaerobaculia bacterium]|nr:nuclear transport factor 2 family protein [Thermoanaerobaculia bacterium]